MSPWVIRPPLLGEPEGEHQRTEAPCRCRVATRNCTNYGLALRWMLRRGGDGRTKIVVHHAIDMVRLVWEDLVIIQDHPKMMFTQVLVLFFHVFHATY